MAAYSNFRSSTQIEVERDELRAARQVVLDKAKRDYEKTERRKEKARLAGEGTWMLQSVTDRIDKEQKEMEKVKKKKKENKKKKKHKKEKKKKRQSSSSESESSDEEPSWVEQSSTQQDNVKKVMGPTLQRDSWMDGPLVTDIIPTVTRAELREKKKAEEDKKKAETVNLMDQPGKHVRELNPYWKDGGLGVPEEKPKPSTTAVPKAAGDGGLSWLRKAYDRCKQQSQDEGRSLEEIAAERYGSLEKLESMIKDAEKQSRLGQRQQDNQRFRRDDRGFRRSGSPEGRPQGNRDDNDRQRSDNDRTVGRDRDRDSRETDRKQDRDRYGEQRRDRDGEQRRDRDGDHRRDRDDRDRERTVGTTRQDNRDRDSRNRSSSFRDRDQASSRRPFARPRDDSDDDSSHRKRTFMRPGQDGDDASSQKKRTFVRPDDDASQKKRTFARPDEDSDSVRNKPASSSLKGKFARPTDSDGDDAVSSGSRRSDAPTDRGGREYGRSGGGRGGGGGGWRKPGPKETKSDSRSSAKGGQSRRRSSTSSSSSSSSSESEKGEQREEEEMQEEPAPIKVLSEDEMNSLGARILRAELMGDEDLAKQLKETLELARKAKEAMPRSQPGPKVTDQVKDTEEDNTVVLTRTGRDGMVRPLPEQEYDRDRSSGKRKRKMKNVNTHAEGERTKYFDDDDRHDLKTLVQMEKLGTAEDQNAMFARLAGRSVEKTDDDFQVDDMFLSKAAMQQSGAANEEKERSKAIFEHGKVNKAMDKCQYCFNKVPKHLIIAIGSKVYLSLPAHRSLTPGHCLIVPMQHCPAATAMDEDVWQEMQTFRKQLVQMFAAQDQDVMFMETSMHLKHFPHTALECVPLDREIGDMAPIYFKKAMLDAGPEWNSNKKVVDLSKKDIRHSVPKGFPYFAVDFGLQGGFAHVIEDEATFTPYFGREICGGMIDAEPGLWRKPHREGFEEQRKKVLEFEQWWKPYDFTA